MNCSLPGTQRFENNFELLSQAAVPHRYISSNHRHQAAALVCHANSSSTWCPDVVACQCSLRHDLTLVDASTLKHRCWIRSKNSSIHCVISAWTRAAAKPAHGHRRLRAAYSIPNGDQGSSSDSQSTSGSSGGSGSSGSGAGGSNRNGRGGGDNNPSNKLPAWYKVWMWATALTYLVWRWKWRRDRKLAAEQFAKEQQVEQQLKQDWDKFAQRYGVAGPQEAGQ